MPANATSDRSSRARGDRHRVVGSCRRPRTTPARPPPLRSTAWLRGAPRSRRRRERRPGTLARLSRTRCASGPSSGARRTPTTTFVAGLLARADAALAARRPCGSAASRRRSTRRSASTSSPWRASRAGLAGPLRPAHPSRARALVGASRGVARRRRRSSRPARAASPCDGCAAPCVGGWDNAGGIARATRRGARALRRRPGVPLRRRPDRLPLRSRCHAWRACGRRRLERASPRRARAAGPADRRNVVGRSVGRRRLQPELLRRLLEELRDGLGVGALALAARPRSARRTSCRRASRGCGEATRSARSGSAARSRSSNTSFTGPGQPQQHACPRASRPRRARRAAPRPCPRRSGPG